MSVSQPAPGAAELALLETAVAENPGSRLFLRLARAYLEASRLGQAGQALERGLSLQPWDVEGRQLLAEVLIRQGDEAGALAQLSQAAAGLTRHAGLYQALAGLLMGLGRDQEAMVAQRLARDLQTAFAGPRDLAAAPASHAPASPDAAVQDTPTLAEIYAAQELHHKAAEIYRRLLALEPDNQQFARRLAELENPPAANLVPGPDQQVLGHLEALTGAALSRRLGGDGQALLERLEAMRLAALDRAAARA